MDGENNGKPYVQMDDLGGKPTIFGNTQIRAEVRFRDQFFNMLKLQLTTSVDLVDRIKLTSHQV